MSTHAPLPNQPQADDSSAASPDHLDGRALADEGAQDDEGGQERSINALGVIAVFVGVSIPTLVAWLTTGVFSPAAAVLSALVAGLLVLILDRMTRASAAEQVAVQVGTEVDAAVERAVFDARHEAEVAAERVAAASATIARRSRDLLDHEFTLIDRLEADEEDADKLADLFALDHLSTRMNRNVASMLVLAGGWPTRHVRGRPPMSEVLRASAGEVEDYARVDVEVDDDPDVEGGVIGPLLHLISELLEWGMARESGQVLLSGRGADPATYAVSIAMPNLSGQRALQDLQAVVADPSGTVPESVDHIGLHIAARLALGLGVTVSGEASEGAGTSIIVMIPAAVLRDGVSSAARRERARAAERRGPAPATAPVAARQPAASTLLPAHAPASTPAPIPLAAHPPADPASAAPVAEPPAPQPAPAPADAPAAAAGPIGSAAAQPAPPPQPAPAATPQAPRASGWSYAGYVDGSEGSSGSRWALGGRRRGKKNGGMDAPDLPTPSPVEPAPTAAADAGTQPLNPVGEGAAPGQVGGRAQQVAALATAQADGTPPPLPRREAASAGSDRDPDEGLAALADLMDEADAGGLFSDPSEG